MRNVLKAKDQKSTVNMEDALWSMSWDDYGFSQLRIYPAFYELRMEEKLSEIDGLLRTIEKELT